VEFTVDYMEGSNPTLLLYYEGWDGWSSAIDPAKKMTCRERHELASKIVPLFKESEMVPTISPLNEATWLGRRVLRSSGFLYFRAGRPQWFFMAVASCSTPQNTLQSTACDESGFCQGPLLLNIDYSMTNQGSEFSADEQGLLEFHVAVFVLQTLAYAAAIAGVRRGLLRLNKYHVTVKLLVTSSSFLWLSLLLRVIEYQSYSDTGRYERKRKGARAASLPVAARAKVLRAASPTRRRSRKGATC
jgi:hypothetical protein